MGAEPKHINYGLKFQARCLVSTHPQNGRSRWLVGTNALRDDNEVQILELETEKDALRMAEVHAHVPELWHMAPHPQDPRLLATVYNDEGTRGAAVWRVPPENAPLENLAELSGSSTPRAFVWHPADGDAGVSVHDGGLRQWKIDGGSAEASGESPEGAVAGPLCAAVWDPHDHHRIYSVGGSALQVWDARTMKEAARVDDAHAGDARDVDCAPRQQHLVLTCGDDAKLRLWDLRRLEQGRPLAELGGHSHWIWAARFNPAHDCLLLSASSDALVNLWYLPSLSAPPLPPADSRGAAWKGQGPTKDGRVKSFTDHEDSVYSVAWSRSDPWTFASLSYDGRVAVNAVSSQVKYKILI